MIDRRVLTKKEIKKYLKDVPKLITIGCPKERWKQVYFREHPVPYLISTYGRLVTIHYCGVPNRVRVMRRKITSNGYYGAQISWEEKSYDVLIHRLVAQAFIPNPDNKPEVNHKDGNKLNPFYKNLEWNTGKENIRHAYKLGLRKVRCGEEIGDNLYTTDQVIEVCELLSSYNLSYKDIAKKTGVSYDMVKNIYKGKSWKHITKNYDFTNYCNGRLAEDEQRHLLDIHEVCKLLESNEYTLQTISKNTGIKIGMINKILNKECYIGISSQYNISNYKSKSKKSNKKIS